MADIVVDEGQLEVVLTTLESLEAAHGRVRVPLSSVRQVEAVDQPLDYLHGMKLIGTGLVGTAVGTWVSPDGRTFAAEHHRSRGVVIHLEGAGYSTLIIGADDPEALVERIRAAMG